MAFNNQNYKTFNLMSMQIVACHLSTQGVRPVSDTQFSGPRQAGRNLHILPDLLDPEVVSPLLIQTLRESPDIASLQELEMLVFSHPGSLSILEAKERSWFCEKVQRLNLESSVDSVYGEMAKFWKQKSPSTWSAGEAGLNLCDYLKQYSGIVLSVISDMESENRISPFSPSDEDKELLSYGLPLVRGVFLMVGAGSVALERLEPTLSADQEKALVEARESLQKDETARKLFLEELFRGFWFYMGKKSSLIDLFDTINAAPGISQFTPLTKT